MGIHARSNDSTFGAVLIGLTLSSILYGVTLVQSFFYFTTYYKDSRRLKIMVSGAWLVDTVHTIVITHILYYYSVTNYGNPDAWDYVVWSLGLEVGLTTLSALIVQSFFTWRVWILSYHNKILTGILATLVAIAFTTGIACMFEVWKLTTIARLSEMEWLVSVKHSTVSAADIGVALAQCWYLHFARTGLRRTDSLINTLMLYTINRGVLNAIVAVADLISFSIMPDNFVWLALNFVLSKLYSNSLLATLNTRNALRGRGEDTELLSTVTTLRITTSQTDTYEIENLRERKPDTPRPDENTCPPASPSTENAG